MRETDLQRTILEMAEYSGWLAYHTHDSRRSHPGFPDLILVRDHDLLAWELKSATGKLTPPQFQWQEALRNVENVEAAVVRPLTLDWAIDRLRRPRPLLHVIHGDKQ